MIVTRGAQQVVFGDNENLLPNEESTENLIGFLMDQVTARSVVTIPTEITDEFWKFFNELMSDPELKGLGEVSLDVLRIFLTAYEPLITQVLNQVKELRKVNDTRMREILQNTRVIRQDLVIFRRQIRALRHIRHFFDTDPDDLQAQAEVIAQMVREFGPFFIKMAQVAAASSDFLPEEMTNALAVFQEDVEPMTPQEVEQAFLEHELGPMVALLARLEHEQDATGDLVPALGEQGGSTGEHRRVGVVPAGVHRIVDPGGELETGVLRHREGVHVAAQQHRRSRP